MWSHRPHGEEKIKELERRTAKASLGPIPEGLEAKGYWRSARCDQRSSQPVDQSGQRRRRSSAQRSSETRCTTAFEHRRAPTDPRLVGARRRKLWIPGRFMDLSSGSQGHRAGVWCEIPSGTCKPHSQRTELDTPEAHSTSQAASRSGDPALERRTLAGVEKKAAEEGRTIVFIDESGVYLLPIVVRTYAPCGRTPILKEFLSYDHLSLIGAVTPQGRLLLKTYEHSITSQEVIAFLGQLLRLIPGLILVIWDGSPTHRSKAIRSYLAAGAARRIHLEQLPGYAPELNPTEWVWSYLKIADLANVACEFLSELDVIIQKAKKRMQHKPELIQAFILDAGYEV